MFQTPSGALAFEERLKYKLRQVSLTFHTISTQGLAKFHTYFNKTTLKKKSLFQRTFAELWRSLHFANCVKNVIIFAAA